MNTYQKIVMSLAVGVINSILKSFDLPSLNMLAVAIGRCFGPTGCRHWSELSAEEQLYWLSRVPDLHTNHNDYAIKVLQWIPRTVTFYAPDPTQPFPPKMLAGNDLGYADIPPAGQWVGSEGYIAVTTNNRFHIRFFFRPDLSYNYYMFDMAAKFV